MAIEYHKYYIETSTDSELYGTTRHLYDFMLGVSRLDNGQVQRYSLRRLSKGIHRGPATTRRHLHKLIEMGYVSCTYQKDVNNPKWNIENLYTVHPVRMQVASTFDSTPYQKSTVPPIKNRQGKDYNKGVREDVNNSLKRELTLPAQEYALPETATTETITQDVLLPVPEIMRSTARYLLLRTNRKRLSQKEIDALKFLADNHMPARVQKEIDVCVERFISSGRRINSLNFGYIAACLGKQNSRKKKTSSNDKAVKSNTMKAATQETSLKVKERILPLDEAEKAISEYVPPVKENVSFPEALKELHDKIYDRTLQLADQYLDAKYPKDEDGCYIFPEDDDSEDEFPEITLEDYLKLKYPEEKELSADDVQDQKGLHEAYEIDKRCANCTGLSDCPFNRKRGRPVVMMKYGKLAIGYTLTTPCRYDVNKPDPELENRLKKSGLSSRQQQQTFTAYDHSSSEMAVAKAKAILAAKKQTSLVLAGKPGTGKTHLAVAVALDAIQSGRQAIFRTVPDLIAELRKAEWEHTDFFGLRLKFDSVDCLVLDDWGKEKTTDKGMEYLYHIIDYRYRYGKQTIVTTNALNPAELGDVNKIEPLVSRLLENGDWVSLKETENYRLKAEPVTEPEIPTEIIEPVAEEKTDSIETEITVESVVITKPEADATTKTESQDDDGCWSISSILCGKSEETPESPETKEKPLTGIYRYYPYFDDYCADTKKQIFQWYAENYEQLEANNLASEPEETAKPEEAKESVETTEQVEKPLVGIYRYCPDYDSLSLEEKKRLALQYFANPEQFEANYPAPEQQKTDEAVELPTTPEVPKTPVRSIAEDEEFWKEDEDEYRLYGDTGIPGRNK